ncbi:MAG TPA: BTAD domain-containing putative transcriptional regulator, partial [Longimicrobiales bacterium]|nr:BTAD domain-containing putative transcriptional regulator [Longimicrobiales bacterium]
MVRLALLGTTDLRDAAGEPIHLLLRQPRRFALLAFLALESRHGAVRRDRVLGVFWPEVAQCDGRRALSQALHYLRRAVGSDAVLTRGSEELSLDPDRISCDACDFLAALDAGEPETALRQYRGDLLPGFYGGVRDFDDWLDRTRDELRRRAAEAAWAAAAAAAEQGAGVAAGAHARRAAELTGGDEPAVRRLMALLAELGDRAGALEAYGALADRLREEYAAAPAAETADLAGRIRDMAPDVAPPIEHLLHPEAATPDPATVTTGASPMTDPVIGPVRAPVRLRQRVRSVAVTLALGLAFISMWGLRREDVGVVMPAAAASARVLVEDVRGPGELAESLTSEIVRRLADAGRIQVLLGSPGDAPATDGPHFLLRTSVSGDADSLRAIAILTDRMSGAAVASTRVAEAAGTPPDTERLGAAIVSFARRATG